MSKNKMQAIIFYSVAEYCDTSSKLTIKYQGNKIKTELWNSDAKNITIKNYKFFTNKQAYNYFKIKIAEAIFGGWKVLNPFPQRETWETKRSK